MIYGCAGLDGGGGVAKNEMKPCSAVQPFTRNVNADTLRTRRFIGNMLWRLSY
jgi:hypothetical protein